MAGAKVVPEGQMTQINMGVGQAVLRLIQVENMYQSGVFVSEDLVRERELIVQALDQFELDLGFDCDGDGLADIKNGSSIFKVSAETSCCRILPKNQSSSANGSPTISVTTIPSLIKPVSLAGIPKSPAPKKLRRTPTKGGK